MKLFRLLTDCNIPYRKNNYLQVVPIIPDPSLKIDNFKSVRKGMILKKPLLNKIFEKFL